MLTAPNGVPLINITAPSAAGVSRNVYRQFDVNANGAILNNSRTAVQTQLGGFVQGNPWLARGSARVILNEVNSSAPSYLRGYVEVAGPKAEVIIANPSGIQVQGGGFINASRATLTTGVPQMNAAGGIESYRVSGGTIGVSGAGLDARGTEFAALYARMVSINAGVWAGGELRVVTGANQVSAESGLPTTPVAGTGAKPPLAFDVAALGGMYAQKIWIMGTEAGVGARNAGTIQTGAGNASLMGIGELTVTASGRIENIGTIQAAGNASISAPTIANGGTVASAGRLSVTTQGDLVNAGGTLEAQRIELASAAGGIDNRGGTIRQTSSAGLTVDAPALGNTQGGTIGAEPLSQGTGTGGTAGSDGQASAGPSAGGEQGAGSVGGSDGGSTSQPHVPPAPGTIVAAGAIANDGGRIYTGGPITLQTPQINNAGGSLDVTNMAVAGDRFSNAGGTLKVSNSFRADVGQFDNSGGKLIAGSFDIATTGDLLNQDGTLASNGDVVITAGGMLNNARGTISATGALAANVTGAVNNDTGTLIANQNVALSAAALDNTQGAIQSAQARTDVTVSGHLLNAQGTIGGGTDLMVRAGSLNNSGVLRGTGDTGIGVAGALSNDGSITAGRNTTIAATKLLSGAAGVLGAGVRNDGALGDVGDLSISTASTLAAHGTQLAAGNASFKGAGVDLSSSTTSGANIAITATQGDVITSGSTVATTGTLSIAADSRGWQALVNQGGVLNAGQLDLRASNIVNTNGGEIVQTGPGATTLTVSGKLDNSGGRIATNGQELTLQAGLIANTSGRIEHAGTGALRIAADGFEGADGQITSNGAFAVDVTGRFNQDGGTTTAKQITIDAGSLGNRGGTIVQSGTDATQITVVDALDNSNAGTIASNGATALTSGSLNNQAGSIRVAGTADLSVNTAGLLDNSAHGEIGAGGNVALSAGKFVNDAGRITAVGDLGATVAGAATNVDGTLAANGETTISAASLDSTRGTVAAVNGDLNVATAGTTVNASGTMQAGGNVALANGGLDNTAGKVFGNTLSIDTHGHTLTNTQGTLAAATTLALNSGTLMNDSGLIQSGGTNAAGYSGGQGGITSAETLDLNTGNIDNTAGYIGAKDALTASTGAISNVNGGVVFGQSNVTIDTHGAAYDNSGGKTQAVGDLTITAGDIANTAGPMRSVATTTLSAGTITNANTQGSDQGIEGRDVALHAGNLDNTSGAIRSDVNTTIISSGNVNNAAGLISAGDTLRIVDPNSESPAAKTLSLTNTNGTLVANQSLQVDAASFSGDGTIASGKDLALRWSRTS